MANAHLTQSLHSNGSTLWARALTGRCAPWRWWMEQQQVIWLDPDIFTHQVIWDNSSSANSEKVVEVRSLMNKALQDPLSQPEQQVLLAWHVAAGSLSLFLPA